MSLGYPYSYNDELTLEMTKMNWLKLFLLFLFLVPNSVEAAPIPGAEGYIPQCPRHSDQGMLLKSALTLSSSKSNSFNGNNPKNKMTFSEYIKDFDIILGNKQLQKKFKHAPAFGVKGDFSMENLTLFKKEIISHLENPSTEFI